MAAVIAATLLHEFRAMAADEPADKPAQPAPVQAAPAPADNTVRQARRQQGGGNFQGGRGTAQDPAAGGNNFQRGNNGGGFNGAGFNFNFDDKQRELLQEARQGGNDELRKLNEKLVEAQKDYVKAVVAEKYDESTVREKADAIGRIQAQILALNAKSFATVSPTLKPEQRETLEGNTRIAIGIISPAVGGFGGGNFAGGPGAGFGGGRGNFGPGGGLGGDPAAGGFGGGGRGGRGNLGPGGGAGVDPAAGGGGGRGGRGGNFGNGGGAGGDPGNNNTRRRGTDNQVQ
jgi:Spy/CpxP family protein refolding chaperone